jgi:hypothetical protein
VTLIKLPNERFRIPETRWKVPSAINSYSPLLVSWRQQPLSKTFPHGSEPEASRNRISKKQVRKNKKQSGEKIGWYGMENRMDHLLEKNQH